MSSQYRKSSRRGASQSRERRKSSKKAAEAAGGRERRKEILGVLVIAFALLWALAVVTYNANDNELVSGKPFWQLFFPEEGSQVTNGLGPIGAYLATLSVPRFFGKTSLLVNLVVVACGYMIIRRRHLKPLLMPSVTILVAMGFVSTMLARISIDVDGWDAAIWAGGMGMAASAWMHDVLGSAGSYGILALFLTIGLLAVIDYDIQRTLDRLESSVQRLHRVPRQRTKKTAEATPVNTPDTATWDDLEQVTPKKGTATTKISPRQAHQEPPHEKTPTAATSDSEVQDEAPTPDLELKVFGQVEVKKAKVVAREADAATGASPYKFPPIRLLDGAGDPAQKIDFDELEENKRTLLNKLAVYKIEITDINAVVGPTVTLYELTPAPGVKISRIKSLEDDLAMAMAARGIRMIAPIPGKSVIGVEIPNRKRELVHVEHIIGTTTFADAGMELPVALGKTVEGEVFLEDLTRMPHLLIAGATGSGKSVGLNALVAGLLFACHPTNLKFVMIDPKKIELQQYRDLRNHYLAIPEDKEEAIITEVVDALSILKSCELEMEARYNLLAEARVRSIKDYNAAFRSGSLDTAAGHKHLPYIVVLVDELADLMMTAGKDIEAPIARLAQMARAIGIHLVLATQRPSVDVITGLIKANFPSRVAFQVASKIDARTILDQNGAEQLVGNGDLLYMNGSRLVRLQGPFVSVKEIDRIMDAIRGQEGPGPYRLPAYDARDDDKSSGSTRTTSASSNGDTLFDEAARIIVRAQQGSVSLLQRKLSIGYTRAARIVDELERIGVVGSYQGAKAREVLVQDEMALDQLLGR